MLHLRLRVSTVYITCVVVDYLVAAVPVAVVVVVVVIVNVLVIVVGSNGVVLGVVWLSLLLSMLDVVDVAFVAVVVDPLVVVLLG